MTAKWDIGFNEVALGVKPTIPNEDVEYIHELIDEAVVELGVVIGDIDAWVGHNTTRADRVRTVLKRMVRRVLRNPSGFVSETDGDYSYTRAASEGLLGDIAVTKKDRRTLGLRTTIRPGSIRVGLPADSPRNMTTHPRHYR